jgi:hypothetical protein
MNNKSSNSYGPVFDRCEKKKLSRNGPFYLTDWEEKESPYEWRAITLEVEGSYAGNGGQLRWKWRSITLEKWRRSWNAISPCSDGLKYGII